MDNVPSIPSGDSPAPAPEAQAPEQSLPTEVVEVGDGTYEAMIPSKEEVVAQQEQAKEEHRLAGKYDSVDALEKAYLELQSKMGDRPQENTAAPTPENQPEEDRGFSVERGIEEIVKATGLRDEDIITQWQQNKQLLPEQYEAFKQQGYGKEVVDTFIAGQEAQAAGRQTAQDNMKSDAANLCGGEAKYDMLMAWAETAYDEGQKQLINERLADPRQYQGAIKEMLFDWDSKVGADRSASLAQPGSAPAPDAAGFTSTHEVLQAMAELKAKGYADEVLAAKISNTPDHLIQGIDSWHTT
tara:strand:+ start:240 stop:1136 length:897 start_codon:yes stop_codon:yes gene_type:complete